MTCARCGIEHPGYRRESKNPFWSRVCKGRDNECWLWMGGLWSSTGYGKMSPSRQAHRVSWELHHGTIPQGIFVCHHCDNPRCVRPEHLFLGAPRDNTLDAKKKGRLFDIKGAPKARGESVNTARLTAAQVVEMRAKHAAGKNTGELGREYGVPQQHAWNIVHRKAWRHVP